MAKYHYVALRTDGHKQTGTIVAPSSVSARFELASRQLKVRSLRERKKFTEIQITKTLVKPQDIANLSRQLSAFLRAGVPVIDALEAIAEETKNGELRAILPEMTAQLRAGDPFSDVIGAHAEHFPSYYPGIIRSAELSGNLDVVLEQLSDYIDRDLQTRRRVKSALTYPTILAIMSVLTVTILVGFVLPKFKDFFKAFGAKLPFTTRFLLGLGDFAQKSGFLVVIAGVAISVIVATYARTEAGRLTKDRLALRIPVMRGVVQAAVIERFCRILSAMVQAGIPISDGMRAAIDSTDNRVYSRKLVQASEEMLQGRGFAAPLSDTGLFPGMVTQMMRVGEDTGTLDRQLDVAAVYYEKELSFKLERMTSLFEPAIIVVMGLVVGFVAVALVQAMYGVYSQSGGGLGK
jgi:type IV pilus assembly protein PilC